MIVYPCANCERDLEVDDALAGQRVRCPHCQNVEVAPAKPIAGVARPAADKAAKPGSPAAPQPSIVPDPERELARVHPVMIRARPVLGSINILTVLAGIGLALAAHFSPGFAGYRWVAWAGWIVAAAGGLWLASWKIRTLATTVIVTTRRTIVHRGLLKRASKELRHEHVQDIQITQSLPQRLLRVGTLGLDGGGTDDVEIVVTDLPDPARLRELVDGARG